MNLHLMLDEKVISRTIQYFDEAQPGNNKYIIFSSGNSPKYVSFEKNNVFYLKYNSEQFWRVVGNPKDYSNIIFHSLALQMIKFATSRREFSNLVWIIWGGDLYNKLLAPLKYELYAYPAEVKNKGLWRNISLLYRASRWIRFYQARRALSNVSKVAASSGDFKLLQQFFPKIKVERLVFFYYPIDDILNDALIDNKSHGNSIMVGNSASYTGNHHRVFELISKCNLGERKVVVPLSYGPAKEYVMKWGQILLPSNFCPVTVFLPLDEYNKLMLSSSHFIYGNYRQEAMGNIIVALYLGGVIILDPKNPLFEDLRELGFIIFSIENIDSALNYNLTSVEVKHNRGLVCNLYSKERLFSLISSNFA